MMTTFSGLSNSGPIRDSEEAANQTNFRLFGHAETILQKYRQRDYICDLAVPEVALTSTEALLAWLNRWSRSWAEPGDHCSHKEAMWLYLSLIFGDNAIYVGQLIYQGLLYPAYPVMWEEDGAQHIIIYDSQNEIWFAAGEHSDARQFEIFMGVLEAYHSGALI